MAIKSTSTRSKSINALVRPVVRLCLRLGVRFQELSSEIERAYVELAHSELLSTRKDISTSKLSVMTGIRRPTVSAILDSRTSTASGPAPADVAARVIGAWMDDKRYSSSRGKPKDLSYAGLASEFALLVRSVSADLNHHTVLFELERLGVVHRAKSRVCLDVDSYVTIDKQEGLAMLASDISDLSAAVQENIASADELPHLHARTVYDNVAVSDLPKIRRWMLALGRQVHQRARKFISKFDRDITPADRPKDARARVVLGTFGYTAATEPAGNKTAEEAKRSIGSKKNGKR